MIKSTLLDFLKFIKKPDDSQIELSNTNKFKFIFSILLFEIIITALVVLPILHGIDRIVDLKEEKWDYFNTLLSAFIIGVILSPLIEELIFRYILRYQGLKTNFINLKNWNKIFPYLVYIFSAIFAIVHLTNFQNTNKLFYIFSPIIVLSQFIGGLTLSYVRVRLSFTFGVLFHMIWNFLMIIIIPLVENAFTKPYVEKSQHYTIHINEQVFYTKQKNQVLEVDSLEGKFFSIHAEQYSIQHILDTLYKKDQYYVDDILVNLTLESKNGVGKDEFIKILKKEYDIE